MRHPTGTSRGYYARWLAALALLLVGNPAAAQHDSGAAGQLPQTSSARRFCWSERPASRCRSFLVFDHGYLFALRQTKHCKTENGCWTVDPSGARVEYINAEWEPDFTSNAFFDLGRMWYRGERSALGFSTGVGVGLGAAYGHTYWLKYRQRWWSASGRELEIAVGPALSYAELWEMLDWVAIGGATAEIKLAHRDSPPFALRIGAQHFAGVHDRTAVFAGMSFRSRGALIASAFFPLLWVALYHP